MTARKPNAKPRIDFFTIPGYAELSHEDRRLFRANLHYHGLPYTVETFRARRCWSDQPGIPSGRLNSLGVPDSEPAKLRTAHRNYCKSVGERDYWDWKAQYQPTDDELALIEKGLRRAEALAVLERRKRTAEKIESLLPEHLRRRVA